MATHTTPAPSGSWPARYLGVTKMAFEVHDCRRKVRRMTKLRSVHRGGRLTETTGLVSPLTGGDAERPGR
jgi:hypothetical protein